MSEGDIPRMFSEILVFENTFSLNKDWEDSVSKNNYPSFMQFELQQRDKVFLRVTTG